MKFLSCISIFALILTMSSCLTYRTIEYIVKFGENLNNGELTVTYTDIRSSGEDPKKQSEDFDELIKMQLEDQFLLDHVEMGIYVKEREIYEENGMLNGKFTGIFKKLGLDDAVLELKGEERYILIDIDASDKIETNGKLFKTGEKALLVWPKEQKRISYKVTKEYDEPTYSINHLYREWLNK